MLATKSENIEVAYKELKRLSQDEEKRMEYEARQKAIRDYNHLMYQSKQEGLKEGFEKGEELGLKKGEELGLKKGKMETAKKFLLMGLSIEQVAEGTGLTLEQVEKLKAEVSYKVGDGNIKNE